MAYEVPGFTWSLPAGTDWSATNSFRFVNVNSSKQAVAPSAGGDVVGVRQNKPRSGEATTIVVNGISMVEASAGITAGNWVAATGTGQAATATTGQQKVGRALETAGGAGELIAVLLVNCGAVV